ncbi:hypothetical protein [Sphingomonas koreensis]
MNKLRLPARVPNDGAHRLANWMLGTRLRQLSEIRIEQARRALGDNTLDRILVGELLPCEIMGTTIANLTGGAANARDFRRPCGRQWGDRPAWQVR